MGDCPCPRCLIPKSLVHQVGTPNDSNVRSSQARVDDAQYRASIMEARKQIYEKNTGVDGAKVERELKPQSLVPTQVSNSCQLINWNTI
jgi:hypothetical protein